MYDVMFKFEQKGLEPLTIKDVESYRSVLEVVIKNNINLHYSCGGVLLTISVMRMFKMAKTI